MVQQQKGPAAAEPKQFIFQFYPLLRIHIHIHDPGHDQIKPGSRIGKPCCKERQHHVHSDLSVDHMTCWASEFSSETSQQIADTS